MSNMLLKATQQQTAATLAASTKRSMHQQSSKRFWRHRRHTTSTTTTLPPGRLATRAQHSSAAAENQKKQQQQQQQQHRTEQAKTEKKKKKIDFSKAARARRRRIIDRMVRVDHAGEYGALRIYDGQLAVLGRTACAPVIAHMREQERIHLRNLEEAIPARRVRPTALLPFWHVAGFALGAGTALLGEKAAMACTVAVEEVITAHYNDQLRTLNTDEFKHEESLRAMIKQHRDEEEEHMHTGLEHDAEQAPMYDALTKVIKAGCHAAIWVSKRV
jgi:ubiquinone biosynthesis monooxygenase Coq7